MKKINIPKSKIILATPLALLSLEIYFGTILGYLAGEFGSGKNYGQAGTVKSVIFNIGSYKLHLHHWLIGLGILISAFWYQFLPLPQFAFGFLGGLIFQGISRFPDWRKILTKRI